MALADWIDKGEPQLDVWPVDIRRFGGFNINGAWLKDRVAEVLGLHYKMPWPNRELDSARPFRRSPLYDRLDAKGALWGSKMGFERPNVFAPAGAARAMDYGWGRPSWFDWHVAEQQAVRRSVGLFDLSSFAKLLIQGRDAEAELQRLSANDVAVPVGRTVYTGLLNARGGYESDVTLARLGPDRFLLVTGTAQATRDADWLARRMRGDAHVTVTDVTGAYAVLALMGPKARALLQKVTPTPLADAEFAFGDIKPIGIGYASALAARRTYVGELGWELFVPVEFAATAYDTLQAAGVEFGLKDCGYYALEALRLEKGYRAWGRELTPDVRPGEAGLTFAVRLDKGEFIGRSALLEARAQPPQRRVVSLVAASADAPIAWGGELVTRDGQPVGDVTSAGYGAALERVVMLALIDTGGIPLTAAGLAASRFEVDVAGVQMPVVASLAAPFDPTSARVKG
jgi:4-methylaminobutanoate oxidase (formaldehyde-forming)